LYKNIKVISNDPENPAPRVRVKANIVSQFIKNGIGEGLFAVIRAEKNFK